MKILVKLCFAGHPVFLDTIRKIHATAVKVQQDLGTNVVINSKGNIDNMTSILEWTG